MSLTEISPSAVPSIAIMTDDSSSDKWRPNVIEKMKALIAEHISTREISIILSRFAGEVISRNAVIGKARRLGIPLLGPIKTARTRTKPVKPKVIVDRPLSINLKPVSAPKPPTLAEVVANPKRLGILEIERGQCYWPTNLDGVTLFCGHPTGSHEQSWCAPHRKLGYAPPGQRQWRK